MIVMNELLFRRLCTGRNQSRRHEPAGACKCRYEKSVGSLLTPPLGEARALGPLQPTAVAVEGRSWRESSMDIAIAG